MKSIVIIIALFFVKLNLLSQWSFNSNYSYLKVSDTTITFSKINNDFTKLFVYSKIKKVYKVWDLLNGKLLIENKMPYRASLTEYDFKNNIFYFLQDYFGDNYKLDTLLPKYNYYSLWTIDSSGKLESKFIFPLKENTSFPLNLNMLKFMNDTLFLHIKIIDRQIQDLDYHTGKLLYLQNIHDDSLKVLSSDFRSILGDIKYFQGGFACFMNDAVYNYKIDSQYYNINYIYLRDNANNYVKLDRKEKKYNVYWNADGISIFDISKGIVACSDDNRNIQYIDLVNKNNLGYTTLKPNYEMRFYKLINNKYSLFSSWYDILFVYNNYKSEVVDIFTFKDGFIFYDSLNNIVYSLTDSYICKTSVSWLQNTNVVDEDISNINIIDRNEFLNINSIAEFDICIYNVLGDCIVKKEMIKDLNFDKTEFSTGVYFAKAHSYKFNKIFKFFVQ